MTHPSGLPHRHLAALWFADIVGYTTLAARDEAAALESVERLQTLAHGVAEECGGRVVKGMGDAVLVEFPSTEAAVRSALLLRQRFDPDSRPDAPVRLRIGVHVGDVVKAPDGDLYGDGVNVAARLQQESAPGEILVSGDVWRQLRQLAEYRFTAHGARTLRGQDRATEVFTVDEAETAPAGRAAAASGAPVWHILPARLFGRLSRPSAAIAVVALVAVVALAAWLGPRFRGLAGGGEPITLAVLPFDNLSGDEATEAFVLGVHDDMLTNLSSVGTFRVISRSSVMGYRDSDKTIREIGRELGANVVLEGGIQRAGDRIRINIQLIDARTDQHLWAQRYNRALTPENVFAIQGEIAERIAIALRAVLSPEARIDIGHPPTANMEALDLYYRGLEAYRQRGVSSNAAREAERMLEAAVVEDPQFADAWATLARARSWLVRIGLDTDPGRARDALERARDLAPEAHATALAEGDFLYYAQGDLQGAVDHFASALERWPDDSDIHGSLGIVLRRVGRWSEAVAQFETALQQDPRNASLLRSLGSTYWMLREHGRAIRAFDRVAELTSDNQDALVFRFMYLLERQGDLLGAQRYLAENAQRFEPGLYAVLAADLAYSQRDYEGGFSGLDRAPIDPDFPQAALFYRAVLSRGAGRERDAVAWADSLRASAERDIERARGASTDPFGLEAKSLGWRGVAYALQGRRADAARDAARAVELMPVSRDAVEGAEVLDYAQMIYALSGDRAAAFPALEAYYLTPAAVRAGSGRLKLEPMYDGLRSDPRFAALVRKVEEQERRGSTAR